MAKFTDMQAHVELDTTLAISASQSFDEILATFGLPGFQVSFMPKTFAYSKTNVL